MVCAKMKKIVVKKESEAEEKTVEADVSRKIANRKGMTGTRHDNYITM